jgi:hypothetical protein
MFAGLPDRAILIHLRLTNLTDVGHGNSHVRISGNLDLSARPKIWLFGAFVVNIVATSVSQKSQIGVLPISIDVDKPALHIPFGG